MKYLQKCAVGCTTILYILIATLISTVAYAQINITNPGGSGGGSGVSPTNSVSLTNKTIDANVNTITNIGLGEVVSDVVSGQTEDVDPATGEFLLLLNLAGQLRKVNISNLPSAGETNTISNVGVGGESLVDGKVGADLQLNSINAGSAKISVTADAPNNEVDIDVVEGSVSIGNLLGAPTGAVVGTTDSQTLTNKTLNADSNILTNIGSTEIKAEIVTGLTEDLTPVAGYFLLSVDLGGNLRKIDISSIAGNVEAIFNCSGGDCSSVSMADGDLLDASGVNPNTGAEGIILPQGLSCSGAVTNGQLCWDSDNFDLYVGNGTVSEQIDISSITSIFDCGDGACTSITVSDGGILDFSSVDPSSGLDGLILPQSATCASATVEGQLCWDPALNVLRVGNGAGTRLISSSIDSIYDCTTGNCPNLALADGQLLDMSGVSPNTGTEGLLLPQNTACSVSVEGQACWNATTNEFVVGNGATSTVIGPSPFTGDVESVFGCLTGACTNINVLDGQFLNMSAVNPNTTTEGFRLPQGISCASAVAEGQMCWDTDDNTLNIGDSAGIVTIGIGSGDITSIFSCLDGACSGSLTLSDGDGIDASGVVLGTAGEGVIIPTALTCSQVEEGSLCWDSDSDSMFVGSGAGTVELASAAGVGDVEAVFNCLSGDCASITLADGDFLDFSLVNGSSNTEGIRLPQATDCSASTANGQVCYDTVSKALNVGNGTNAVALGLGTITDIFGCSDGDCANVSLADGDGLDMSAVDPTAAGEGLILPQSNSCTGTGEGQICWDADGDAFVVGTGSGTVTIGVASSTGDIEAVYNCSAGDCGNITVTDGDILDFSNVNVSDGLEGLFLPQNALNCINATGEGQICWDTDLQELWIGNGTSPVLINTSATLTMDNVFDNGGLIDGANSQINALTIGDGADGYRIYVGAGGPTIECFIGAGTCDPVIDTPSGNTFTFSLAGVDAWTIDSSGNVVLSGALRERKTITFPAGMLEPDGVECVRNENVPLNGRTSPLTITCSDNNAATIFLDATPQNSWDSGPITLSVMLVTDDNQPDGILEIDWAAHCVSDNDVYGSGTFGAEQATAINFTGYIEHDQVIVESAEITPSGSCAPGDTIEIRGQVDAAATTTATPLDEHIKWIQVQYLTNDTSDD